MTFKGFMKKFLPVFLMVPVGFGAFTACDNENPDINQEEQPPIIEPLDPDNKNPNNPTDPGKEDPGKENPDNPVTPDDPGKDTPDNPVTPDDPGKENPALTKEQEDQLIVNKILDATLEKARIAVGNGSKINKVLAIDCKTEEDKNYIYLLVDDTNNLVGDCYDLIRISTGLDLERANFLNSEVIPTGKLAKNIFRIDKNQIDNSERTQNIYNKLKADGVLEQTSTPIAMAINEMGGGVDNILQSSYSCLWLYTLSQSELEYTYCAVKDDSGTKDYVTDYLLNGTLNKHYREVKGFYYKFSNNAIKDFENGLTKKEVEKTTYTAGPIIYFQKEQAI